jgi:uncharacterized membrane protein YeaQ/YmgE (transglycosylase-associated protein family)
MQAVGPTQLIILLVAVAVVGVAAGFLASVVVRRNKRRTRGGHFAPRVRSVFVLGFLCGVTAGALVRTRRRIRHVLGTRVGVRPRRAETRSDAYRLAARALALTAGRSRS